MARSLLVFAIVAVGRQVDLGNAHHDGVAHVSQQGECSSRWFALALSPPMVTRSHHSYISVLSGINYNRRNAEPIKAGGENQTGLWPKTPCGSRSCTGIRGRHLQSFAIYLAANNANINGEHEANGVEQTADNESRSDVTQKQNDDNMNTSEERTQMTDSASAFDAVINARYACTRFQRYQEPTNNTAASEQSSSLTPEATKSSSKQSTQPPQTILPTPSASISNPTTLQKVYQCLSLAQRAPTGFNAQPYRIILVHSQKQKQLLAEYCLGRNADRVRDSDCTAVFLADRECGRDGARFAEFLVKNMDGDGKENADATNADTAISATTREGNTTNTKRATSRTRRPLSPQALRKLRLLILLFSSGYPLPQFLSIPFSLGVRTAMTILSFFARLLYSAKRKFRLLSSILPKTIQLLPTLSSAETWSQKNTMLVAMTYMLACTSRGLATCPMEGFDANGVKKVLGITPRGRFGIPLIVCAGTPYRWDKLDGKEEEEEKDDVGLSHGGSLSPRYPLEEVVYGDAFGVAFQSV